MVKNATPKRYRTKFIEPGLADYTAEGFGKVLVSKEALDEMLRSFIGKPVYLEHQDIPVEEAFNENLEADGVVSEVGYDDSSGWFWADMLIWDGETIGHIDYDGYTVSCAYDVDTADGRGGRYHAIDYDQEVKTGEYTHMAIVNNPRYEGATIIENSTKDAKGGIMKKFRLLGKAKNEAPEEKKEKDEIQNMAPDSIFTMENGMDVPVSELVAAYNADKKEEDEKKEAACNVVNMDDEVEVDGKKVKVSEMYDSYKKRQNAELPQDEVAEEVVDDNKVKNSMPKKNENFKKVENAASFEAEAAKPQINTRSERLARGKARYSLKEDK